MSTLVLLTGVSQWDVPERDQCPCPVLMLILIVTVCTNVTLPKAIILGPFLFLPLYTDLSLSSSVLKGTVVRDGFFAHCILSRKERKDLKFFSCCANIYWVRARFNSFCAQGEYAEWYFPVGQAKNCNFILFSKGSSIISRLPWFKFDPMESS